jgi:lipid-binding SYLF domain-containing protein
MQKKQFFLLLAAATVLPAGAAADDTAERLGKAATVLNKMTESGIPAEKFANADCIAVIPAFKKSAAGIGVGYGKGFISCRNGNEWSAPGAITMEISSLGIQVGGEGFDLVLVSLSKEKRSKLLSERFTIGTDASAAWGNGKTANADPSTQIIFYSRSTKGIFAGFALDGAALKPDESSNKALYQKTLTNGEIVAEARTPAAAQSFVSQLRRIGGD